jgi:hypothetical protein
VEDQEEVVDPGEPATAQQLVYPQRRGARAGGDVLGQVGGTGERGPPDLVAGLEVVEVLLAGHGLHHREGDRPLGTVEYRHRQVPPCHVSLDDHAEVVREGRHKRRRHVRSRTGKADPQRRPLACRLDDDREGQPLLDRRQDLGRSEFAEGRLVEGEELRRRYPRLEQEVLGEHLVPAAHAGQHAGPGIGDAEDLEQLLHRPVLAVAPVKGDPGRLGGGGPQAGEEVRAHVHRDHVVAEALQRVLHPGSRAQGHLALE